ncbi:MAG: hypothetical protein M1483_03335 [Actinobacteria bacterium]|nr:hypothetical protein [Actinomycetota bacterium]MCL6104659.1 hypothetical protein [Actinomycetota bacterium]
MNKIWVLVLMAALVVVGTSCGSSATTSAVTSTTSVNPKAVMAAKRRAYRKCLIQHGVVFPSRHGGVASTSTTAPSTTAPSTTGTLKALRSSPTYKEAAKSCRYLKPKYKG